MDDHDARARLLAAAGKGGAGSTERICRLCVDALGVTGAGIARTSSPGTGALVCASDDVAAGSAR